MAVATVIGGAGRMGAWFANLLSKSGYRIIISDTNRQSAVRLARKNGYLFLDQPILAVQPAQLVILATPTQITQRLLKQIGPHIPERNLLVEISSVKEPVRKTLQRLKRRGKAILSIHPMFGPGVKTLRGKNIITVMVPSRNLAAKEFLSLFRNKGAKILHSNFEKHDKLVSLTLSLPHFLNFAITQTLKSDAADLNELRAFAGSTFNLQLLLAEALYQEDFSNEASILMDNAHSLKILRLVISEGDRILSMINKGERNGLNRELSTGRSYLRRDKGFASAYRRFNTAVEVSGTR